jgi:ParB/RepB/Spo0J family partition protein
MLSQPVLARISLTSFLRADPDHRDRESPSYRKNADRLRASIREFGIFVPLVGFREGPKVRLIDGNTRWIEAFQAGLEDAPVLVYETKPDAKQLDLAKIIINDVRADWTKWEKLQAMLNAMKEHNLSLREIGRLCSKSPSQMSKDLAPIKRAVEPVKEMVFSGKLCGRQGWSISRLPAEEQHEFALRAAGRWSAETTEEKVQERLGGKKSKKKRERVVAKGAFATIMDGVESAKALAVSLNKWIKDHAITP